MLAKYTPQARWIVVRSGLLAMDAGRGVVGTDLLLLALAEADGDGDATGLAGGLAGHGVSADAVRDELRRRRRGPAGRPDRELLALLGIDLDDVRRRVSEATSTDARDPALWHLRRSRVRPLRLTLAGPAGSLLLDGPSRKVVEVAAWASRRAGRDLVTAEDLLWGLLADRANESVRILRRLGVDLHGLWCDLRRWHAAV
jgi:hypothetical protein